jgi:hypothetical protein
MTNLTIVENIKANVDKIDLVKAELVKLIEITHAKKVVSITRGIKITKTQLISCL